MVVTGIGQCCLDYLALVDSYPKVDTKKEVLQWEEQGGGPVATALVSLARLGIRCRFHGIIGDDDAGRKIRRSLKCNHVDIGGLRKRNDASSQVAFIVIEKGSGKRTIFWKRPSCHELRPKELGSDFLRKSNFLLIDGLMKIASLYAAKKARDMHIPVMLDAGKLREGMLDIAKICDYVVASEEFAKDLGWNGKPEAFRKTVEELRPKVLTITLGEGGSVTFLENRYFHVPAYKVHVLDTTGAGDVFHGGYIFGILQGWNIVKVIKFASAFAALKCRKIGGRAGIPDLCNVLRFMKKVGRRGLNLPPPGKLKYYGDRVKNE